MPSSLSIPDLYEPPLDLEETERAIKLTKDFFQTNLAKQLNLKRVTAPLFVRAGTGINDDLNGIERPVSFRVRGDGGAEVEIVQSLAKWKRMILADYRFRHGEGLYTDMNAIRPDEQLDNLHSIYVDQWDWERVISKEERTLAFLRQVVTRIYSVIMRTEQFICGEYPQIRPFLPDEITFVHSEELEERYPGLSPQQREDAVCREFGAVFIVGIGAPLRSGRPHDGRAPDYDDWSTPAENGRAGLNGDIVVWYPVLGRAFELSSMGIRVDPASLRRQLRSRSCVDREELMWHRRLLNDEFPLSIGGGIGQSRLCMLYPRKAHIGEVQAAYWPDEMIEQCRQANIRLL